MRSLSSVTITNPAEQASRPAVVHGEEGERALWVVPRPVLRVRPSDHQRVDQTSQTASYHRHPHAPPAHQR